MSVATRHIDIKIYVVKEKVQNHTIKNEHMIIDRMLANSLNKVFYPACSENT